jgi:tRNA-Thr(GGU) m(6)t(6)A37 methyltransferase TsaA
MIAYRPIGVLRTPFMRIEGMPIQPCSHLAAAGEAHIDSAYAEALQGLAEFTHVYLLYHLHRQTEVALTVTPFASTAQMGLFATRAPARPNPIGLSVVPLLGVDGLVLQLDRLDMLDGTPLLDIKPYVPQFDRIDGAGSGWFACVDNLRAVSSDRRFAGPDDA